MTLDNTIDNDYQDILNTEDCVLDAFDSVIQDPHEELARKYGKWYIMSDAERWEYLRYANMAYYVH